MIEPFPIIDVSSWPVAEDETMGTKPKHWLRHPDTDEHWLWKQSTSNVDRRGQEYRKGDDWSERVACEVARLLGVPTADVELAVCGDMVGVVSRRFLIAGEDVDECLVHGNELLARVAVVGHRPHDRSGYTLDAVRHSLDDAGPPRSSPSIGAAPDWFAGYLVLDALIGNTDRHQENWGVIRRGSVSRLAPSFDHASCLGFLLSDDERTERLGSADANRSPAKFAERATTKFEDRVSPRVAAATFLRDTGAPARAHWSAAVASMPESLDDVLSAVPEWRMSEPARAFADAIYRNNLAWLSQHLPTMPS